MEYAYIRRIKELFARLLTTLPYLVGFSLDTLDKQADYGLSGTQASQLSGAFNKAQIPIVMDHTYIDTAKTMLANNPPPYMELYNEPDFSFENLTLTEDAAPSASDLMSLIDSSHPNTKFISPALMNANGPWLGSFFDACAGCIDQIDVIALHVYNPYVTLSEQIFPYVSFSEL